MKAKEIYRNLDEHYQNLFDKWVKSAEFAKVGVKTTVCLLTLDNGFEIVGTSSCVHPNMFDATLGKEYALLHALDSVDKYVAFTKHEASQEDFEEMKLMLDKYRRRFVVTRVLDGETVEGTIDLGFNYEVNDVTLKLAGITAPEQGHKGHDQCTKALQEFIDDGDIYVHVEDYEQGIHSQSAVLYVVNEGQEVININQSLVDAGFAVPCIF